MADNAILLATTNAHKTQEMKAILAPLLPPGTTFLTLSDFPKVTPAVENGATFEENALGKAEHYARETGHICVADDSGLCVDALGGAPGIVSSRWAGPDATDLDRIVKLLQHLAQASALAPAERKARFVCAAAAADAAGWVAISGGTCVGTILTKPRGRGGFGYDPIFYLQEFARSMAELQPYEKNRVSHRAKALSALAPDLQARLESGPARAMPKLLEKPRHLHKITGKF